MVEIDAGLRAGASDSSRRRTGGAVAERLTADARLSEGGGETSNDILVKQFTMAFTPGDAEVGLV